MELLIIIISLCVAACVSFFSKRRIAVEYASLIAAAVAVMESFFIAFKVVDQGKYAPSSLVFVDGLGAILLLIISCIGFVTVAYSISYLRKETEKGIVGMTRVRQYFALSNLFSVAMFLAASASNPIFAWISIEATTLSTAFLISFYNKPSAMEAAWKYLIINSIGLLLGFFGSILYFTAIEASTHGGIVGWQELAANAAHLDPLIAKIAFIFILIGYGTKVELAPMHTWLPDAHNKAPAPVSALLSGVLLNVAFFIVLKFKIITDTAVGQAFSQTLLISFGLLSIFISAFIILYQKCYKRLLAYSSIENMGFAALGFGFGGLGTIAALLHLIFHSLVKSALFLLSGNFLLKYNSTKIINVRGAIKALPITSVLFFLGFLIITGVPPFGIFFTKFLTFFAGMSIHPIVVISVAFLSVLVFVGFLKHVTAMIFGDVPPGIEQEKENVWRIALPVILLALAICLTVYRPPFLQALIYDAISRY